MHESLLFVHRWLGLTAGIIFAFASATGAVLIYQEDIERLIGGPRFTTTPGAVGVSVLEASIMQERPDSKLRTLEWVADDNVVIAKVKVGDNKRLKWIYLDAGSGRVIQPRNWNLVLRSINQFHSNLLIGRIGHKLVVYASLAALASLALGIYLWWPGIRKMWTGFRIRWSRGTYLLNLDLHRSLGTLAVPLLFMAAATGVLMEYGTVIDRIENVLHGPRPDVAWAQLRSAAPADSPATLSVAHLVEVARTKVPGARLSSLKLPASEDGVAEARFEHNGSGTAVLLALNRHTGATLAQAEMASFRFDRDGIYNLHLAKVGGPAFRVLYTLACAVGFVLLPTGVVVWWIKRKRKS